MAFVFWGVVGTIRWTFAVRVNGRTVTTMADKELFGISEQLEKDHFADPRKMVGDLISKQAALGALGERPVVWSDNDDYTLGARNQYDMDRLALETVPSAQQWISCEERLPEEEKAYLVTFACEKVGMSSWHKDTLYNRGFDAYMTGVTEDGGCEYFGVVAWCPLPEAWKGGREFNE